MGKGETHISKSLEVLKNNLMEIAQVSEWAEVMGYNNPKRFSRRFLRHFTIRPSKILGITRLKSIHEHLKRSNHSNFEIARKHSLPDEKALNKFVNYHLDCSPTELKEMREDQLYYNSGKFGSKIY